VEGGYGRWSSLPTQHLRLLRTRTLRDFPRRRVEGWSGRGCYYVVAKRRRRKPQTFAVQLPRKSLWWKTGNGESDARNILNASSTRGACLVVASRARVPLNETMCAGSSEIDDSFLYRGRRKASTSSPVHSLPRGEQSSH
jgi:hypothetical protein